MKWELIETAPKDGTDILGYWEGAYEVLAWCDYPEGSGFYTSSDDYVPATHWAKLEPPK